MELLQGRNSGILSELYIARHRDITFSDQQQYLHSLQYTSDLVQSAPFEQIKFIPDSEFTWRQNHQKEKGTNVFTLQTQCLAKQVSLPYTEFLHQYAQDKLIVLIIDNNFPDPIMMGSDEHFAQLAWTEDISGPNVYRISLSARQGHPAYRLSGSYITA